MVYHRVTEGTEENRTTLNRFTRITSDQNLSKPLFGFESELLSFYPLISARDDFDSR